jgi:NAD(P)-dependent dehydrogenase (short-subunit alcohol dehydrogenase family)
MHAEKPLSGQVALITGANRGIGLAIARKVGRLGARLALCARDRVRLEQAAGELRQNGIEAVPIQADVTTSVDVARVVEQSNQALGEIDILVNNAGVGLFRPAHETTEAEWDVVLDTNLKGVFLMSRAVAPQMIRRRSGWIVNIASLAGKNAFANGAIYCASKWGLLGFTYSMAEDLRGYGIRVTAICPGSVYSDFSPHAGKDPRKMLQAEDIAHAIAMVLTAAPGSFISEVVLRPTQKP